MLLLFPPFHEVVLRAAPARFGVAARGVIVADHRAPVVLRLGGHAHAAGLCDRVRLRLLRLDLRALCRLRIAVVALYPHALHTDLAALPCAQLGAQLVGARFVSTFLPRLVAAQHRIFLAGSSVKLGFAARPGQAERLEVTPGLALHVHPLRSEQVDRAAPLSRPLQASRMSGNGAQPEADD